MTLTLLASEESATVIPPGWTRAWRGTGRASSNGSGN
jgi:hypothetical protein